MSQSPNQVAENQNIGRDVLLRQGANGLSAVRSSVAGNRKRTVHTTAAPEVVAVLVWRTT